METEEFFGKNCKQLLAAKSVRSIKLELKYCQKSLHPAIMAIGASKSFRYSSLMKIPPRLHGVTPLFHHDP